MRGPVRGFIPRTIVLGLLVAICAGCSLSGDSRSVGDATTLHMGTGGEPKSLDPHLVTGIIEEKVLSALFEGLVNIDFDTMEAIPGVAESWELSDDATVYTFHLRDDARWSNGDPVTAHDFAYAWRRILSPDLAAEYAYIFYPIAKAEAFNRGDISDFGQVGVDAPDDHTFVVTLRAPTPYFLALQIHYSFYPVHQPTIEAHGGMLQRDTPWTRPGNLVSNGPFALHAWTPMRSIEVRKSDHYWGSGGVALDAIVFHPIQNPSVEERSFRAGELDLTANVPLTKIPTYLAEQPDLIRINPYLATEFIRFNTKRKPFDDARVRQAFSFAINREAIVDNVLKAGQTPAVSFVPPDTAGYTYAPADGSAPPPVAYDPERARVLLAEAGFPGGADFPEVTLIYDTNDNRRILCEALQSMWSKELGVRVELQNMDGKTWLSNMIALQYDLARSFWQADYPDAGNFLEMFYATSGNNRTGFSDVAYEEHLRAAAVATDTTDRFRAYRAAEDMLLRDAPIAPVYHQTRAFLQSPRLRGLQLNNLGRVDYRRLKIESAE